MLLPLRFPVAIATAKALPKPEQDRLIADAQDLIPEWVETLSHGRLARYPSLL
jgi:hypothetical protein